MSLLGAGVVCNDMRPFCQRKDEEESGGYGFNESKSFGLAPFPIDLYTALENEMKHSNQYLLQSHHQMARKFVYDTAFLGRRKEGKDLDQLFEEEIAIALAFEFRNHHDPWVGKYLPILQPQEK